MCQTRIHVSGPQGVARNRCQPPGGAEKIFSGLRKLTQTETRYIDDTYSFSNELYQTLRDVSHAYAIVDGVSSSPNSHLYVLLTENKS